MPSPRRHRPAIIAALAVIVPVLTAGAGAGAGEKAAGGKIAGGKIDWKRELTLAPGEVKEACVALAAGAEIRYRFSAGAPLAFNIHYHDKADGVHYPVRRGRVQALAERFTAVAKHSYCLMWTNRSEGVVVLAVEVQRK